jgi:hypothetical protein
MGFGDGLTDAPASSGNGDVGKGVEIADLQRRVIQVLDSLIRHGMHFLLLPLVAAVRCDWASDVKGLGYTANFEKSSVEETRGLQTDHPLQQDGFNRSGRAFHVSFLLDAIMPAASSN